MATFITIGYGDGAGSDRTPPAVRAAAHEHDAQLQAGGALIGVAGAPVQVRNHEGAGVRATPGPFLRSDLPIAGFAVIEAADIDQAVQMVSGTPCAVAHGVVATLTRGMWPQLSAPADEVGEPVHRGVDGLAVAGDSQVEHQPPRDGECEPG